MDKDTKKATLEAILFAMGESVDISKLAEVIEEDSRPIQAQLAALYFFDLETNTPTNLGILLFGKHPDQFIPSAYLQYVKLSALDNSGDVLAEHAYKGPLLKTLPEFYLIFFDSIV